MNPPELDAVDRGILHMLQEDARNNTASDIADSVGVAPNTVRNRIERLEENGVIQGYHPQIDYEQAGFQLRGYFITSVPISQRREYADTALDVEGTIGVVEILSGQQNLVIEAVSTDTEDLTRIASELESRDIRIEEERFIKSSRVQPFDHFGIEETEE